MPRHRSVVAGALAAVLAATVPAGAGGIAGVFDFYVLALSWSPAYCAGDDDPDPAQCGVARGFVVHGLWPQYEHGWPDYCPSDRPRDLDPSTLAAATDIFPSQSLADYEWRRHGMCSGLAAEAYFALTRAAAERLVVPPDVCRRRDAEPPVAG